MACMSPNLMQPVFWINLWILAICEEMVVNKYSSFSYNSQFQFNFVIEFRTNFSQLFLVRKRLQRILASQKHNFLHEIIYINPWLLAETLSHFLTVYRRQCLIMMPLWSGSEEEKTGKLESFFHYFETCHPEFYNYSEI